VRETSTGLAPRTYSWIDGSRFRDRGGGLCPAESVRASIPPAGGGRCPTRSRIRNTGQNTSPFRRGPHAAPVPRGGRRRWVPRTCWLARVSSVSPAPRRALRPREAAGGARTAHAGVAIAHPGPAAVPPTSPLPPGRSGGRCPALARALHLY